MKTTLEHIKEAMWRAGPGDDALILLEDDEFHDIPRIGSMKFSEFRGYMAVKFEYMGSTVHITCPRMLIPIDLEPDAEPAPTVIGLA